jgi:hypothetical protein
VVAVVVYSCFALVALAAAYFSIFSEFATYDDEGTLLVTLKAFTQGHVLYRDVYSEYGPFYYEVFGGLFALTGKAVTTDASRTIVCFVWVGTSLLYGVAAQRLTGRLALGVIAAAAAFASLGVLASEPMHPQGLCALLLAAFTLLATLRPGRRPLLGGAAAGALLGALVMTKVNLGAFAIAAVILAAVLSIESLRRHRWLVALVCLGMLAMPFAVLVRDLNEAWVRELLLIELLAIAAILVAATPFAPARNRDGEERPLLRWLLGAAAGLLVAAIAILVAIFLTGLSPADVWKGMVTEALRVRDVLISPLPYPRAAVDWAVAALAASFLVVRLRPSAAAGPSLWPGLLRAGAGVAILLVVTHIAPFSVGPNAENPVVVPMALAWVAAIPPAGVVEPAARRFLRILLPALAVAETLQVYPVAGSQMGIAATTFVPVAALCLFDALTELNGWSESRGSRAIGRLAIVVAILATALAAQLTLDAVLRPGLTAAVTYRHDLEPLPFPGATTLRLPAERVEVYAGLVDLLHRHRCTTFVGYPNLDSLYLWSGIEPPPPRPPGAWMKALTAAQQQRAVDAMKASPRPCAIRSDVLAEAWLHGEPPPETPLVEYIFNGFRPVATVGEFSFLLPKGAS